MSRDSGNAGSNLVCFLVGAAVGAAVALLYAPQEGTATRRLLGDKATEARDKAGELTATAKEKVVQATDKVQALIHKVQALTPETTAEVTEAENAVEPTAPSSAT